MILLRTLLGSLICILLFGCTTLTVESDGRRLSTILGIEHDDIRFIGVCDYDKFVSPRISKVLALHGHEYFEPIRGIIALTQDDIHLLEGNLKTTSTKKEIRIPISKIHGIDIRNFEGHIYTNQLQLLVEEYLIVLRLTWGIVDDPEGTQRLYDQIISFDVPTWKSEKFYGPNPESIQSEALILLPCLIISSLPINF